MISCRGTGHQSPSTPDRRATPGRLPQLSDPCRSIAGSNPGLATTYTEQSSSGVEQPRRPNSRASALPPKADIQIMIPGQAPADVRLTPESGRKWVWRWMSAYDPLQTSTDPDLITETDCQSGRFRLFRAICGSYGANPMSLRWLHGAQLNSTDFTPICHRL